MPGRIPGYHLSKEGKAKAEKTGSFFEKKAIGYIYTSPLERAYETANIITKYLPKAKISHAFELTEVDSIHWQAYKYEELFTNNYYEAFLSDPNTDQVPENLTSLAARMKKFTLSLCKKHPGRQVICVSHEFPILALQLTLEKKPLQLIKNYNVSMASITSFIFDENSNLLETIYTELQ